MRKFSIVLMLTVLTTLALILAACGGSNPSTDDVRPQTQDGTNTIIENITAPEFVEEPENNDAHSAHMDDDISYEYDQNILRMPIAAGSVSSFAIQSDRSLWAWGSVVGISEDLLEPIRVTDGVISVSAGSSHVAAIKTDGSLWVWGGNTAGQIGDGTRTILGERDPGVLFGPIPVIENNDRYSPVRIMDNVIAMSLGGHHTMAITSDGSLWAWGSNHEGSLGDGTATITEREEVSSGNSRTVVIEDNNRLSPLKIMDNVAYVSAGSNHTMAITEDGSLWAWGSNSSGQLGDGTTENRHSPMLIMEDVIAVSAGSRHTAAIKSDNSLWVWGLNMPGTFGIVTDELVNPYPIKVMENVKFVSAGSDLTKAITSDSTLWVSGHNQQGQLGLGDTEALRDSFTKVKESVASISTGPSHSIAVSTDGRLWTWGANWNGRLGDGTEEHRSLPVQVMDSIMMPN